MHTLKKSHFAGRIIVMADAVSNGHWAIRKSAVKNADVFATAELASKSLGIEDSRDMDSGIERIMPGGELHQWNATKFCYDNGLVCARVFQSTKTGAFAGIDVRILDVIGLKNDASATLYGVDPDKPLVNAATLDDAAFVAMPFRIEGFPAQKEAP